MNHVHVIGSAPSGAPPRLGNMYENAGFHEPKIEWSSAALLEVTYIDNVQVVVDRNARGTVSLSLWMIGEESPFDRLDSDIPERYFVVRAMDTKQPLTWAVEQLIDEINRERTGDWSDFTPFNWRQGWDEFVEGQGYQLITLEACSRREAEREQARQ